MRRGAGAGLAVGIRLSADETLPEGRHAPETAAILRTLAGEGLIDYASAVIGDSASYLGSAWIVPPPPVARDAMREPAGILREQLSVPLIATSRIHEPAEAEALLAAGAADAVGMTRALIADPDLPRRIAEGREAGAHPLHRLQPGLHRPLPPRPADLVPAEPAHGPRGAHARGRAAGRARACSSWAAGPPAWRPRVAAARAGAEVTLVEAADALGGQFALAGRAPAHRETAARFAADWSRRLEAAGRRHPPRHALRRPTPCSPPRPIA